MEARHGPHGGSRAQPLYPSRHDLIIQRLTGKVQCYPLQTSKICTLQRGDWHDWQYLRKQSLVKLYKNQCQVQSERRTERMFAFTCHTQPFPNFQTIMNKAQALKTKGPANKASHGELSAALVCYLHTDALARNLHNVFCSWVLRGAAL